MTNITLLTVKEFAARLKVHPMTVRRAIKYGRIHAFRSGTGEKSSYRINEEELQRMMSFDLLEVVKKMKEQK